MCRSMEIFYGYRFYFCKKCPENQQYRVKLLIIFSGNCSSQSCEDNIPGRMSDHNGVPLQGEQLPFRKEVMSMLCQVHQRGQGLVEYALILVLVAIVVVAVLTLLGPIIANVFTRVNEQIPG